MDKFVPKRKAGEPVKKRPAKRAKSDPDLKIIVDDGEVMVHSLILMLASPVFDRMLSSSMREGSGAEARLPGKTEVEFSTFYKSLQLNTMEPLTPESATFLCRWADEYQIDALKSKCEQHLIQFAPVDSASLKHAVTYKLQERAAQCVDVMKKDVAKYLDELRTLADEGMGMVEHLQAVWPIICEKAEIISIVEMPAPDVVRAMWPFLAAAVRARAKERVLRKLRADARAWPNELMKLRLSGGSNYTKALDFVTGLRDRCLKDES